MSRGGLISWAAGMAAVGIMSLRRRRLLAALVLGIVVAVSVALTWRYANEAMRERLSSLRAPHETVSYETRTSAWADSLRIWRRYPLVGAGPNAFRTTFPQHRTSSASDYMTHPENEYVQILAEGGLVGVALAALLVFAVVRRVRSDADSSTADPACLTAVGGTMAAVAVHAMCDFPLHIPAYAVACASILGTGFAFDPDPNRTHAAKGWARLPVPIILTILTALLLAAKTQDTVHLDSHARLRKADMRTLCRALRCAPTAWYTWYRLSYSALRSRSPGSARFAERCRTVATRYDPQNYKLWLSLGKLRLRLGDKAGAAEAFERVRELRAWVPIPPVPGD